ncbi:MAG: 50S ribosomal protein L25 [Desulfobulbaceae bacterium]|nr:50S ribosomal protein L25 [Desulfobulbaceae bacterium]
MLQVDVTAKVRTNFGKGAARTLRRSGQTPAIMYGPKSDPMPLILDTKIFTKTLLNLQRRNAVVNLDITTDSGEEKRHVLIKEVQVDPIYDTLKHADFYEISLDAPSSFIVPVTYKGKAAGVDLGGDMIVSANTVTLKGNPLDIPDSIDIDVSPLNINDKISCKDLSIPDSVTLLDDAEKVCVSVVSPHAEPAVADEEEATE